ncbi:MAG: hypothetical protein E3K37_01890 [Candidatus Kuenenia sp.]|nr:hypothetical protein [Candidatus Kuenenia hertensis]
MKKYISVAMLILCVVGCGKSETEKLEEKISVTEINQSNVSSKGEHDFIKNEEGFIVHMKDIKLLLKHLQTSINKEDWKAIQQDTKKLKNASPVVFTGENKDNLPKEFVQLDVQFHLDTLELVNACQEKNKDKAMAAFFKVVNGCDECHAKFNPKETSASWFH